MGDVLVAVLCKNERAGGWINGDGFVLETRWKVR